MRPAWFRWWLLYSYQREDGTTVRNRRTVSQNNPELMLGQLLNELEPMHPDRKPSTLIVERWDPLTEEQYEDLEGRFKAKEASPVPGVQPPPDQL